MSISSMLELRSKARLTQAQMARRMGFTRRGYQDLEEERSSFAPRHLAVLERISIALAVERSDPALALQSALEDALKLATLMLSVGHDRGDAVASEALTAPLNLPRTSLPRG